MPNLQSIGLTNGKGTSGTGNASTVDALFGYNCTCITTIGTTTIKGTSGFLHTIVINQVGGGTVGGTGGGSITTVYDSLSGSGTLIAPIDTVSTAPQSLLFDCVFNNGLTVVTTGANNIAPSVSFNWK